MSALDWHETERARELLAELDACERSSDHWYGKGGIARAFSERCEEIESELDDLRSESVIAFANAVSPDRTSDAWLDAEEDADSEAVPVAWACQQARISRMGDALIERAAAA